MSLKKFFTATLICLASASIVFGQTAAKYPFGQNVTYPNGFKPTTVDTAKVRSWYSSWQAESLRPCAGKGIMVTADDNNQVKVEGVGWAMIATAYMGDKTNFDGIYQFYSVSSNITPRSGGMMSWLVNCNGIYNNNSDNEGTAVDGDLDAAFGLIVASWQWGGTYLDSARALLGRIKPLITYCGDLSVIAGGFNGGVWGGVCNYTDISYYTPAFFRVFAEVTGDDAWEKLADDTYIHLERNAHATTGLVSDWQSVEDGAPFLREGGDSQKDTFYSFDACRTPWRIALDYLWNGNEKAKSWATKISSWAHGVGINNLRSGYSLNGTVSEHGNNSGPAGMAFMGAWAVGAMTNSQAIVNDFGTSVAAMNNNHWYQRHLGNVYLLALTGNMWREDMVLAGGGVRLLVAIDGKGAVKRSPDKYLYASSETVTLTAEPDLGYTFDGWSGEGSNNSKESSITVTMSAARNITAKFILSADGTNLVKNGDFSQGANGMQDWTLNTWGNSQASSTTANGAITININTLPSTGNAHDLQLVQPSLPLLKGNRYEISFEASAAAPRTIVAMSQMANSPWDGYFEEIVNLTTTKETFTFEFEMEGNDDLIARLGFNVGNNDANVTIGNISVILLPPTSSINRPAAQSAKKTGITATVKKSAINVRFNAAHIGVTEIRLYGLKGDLISKANVRTTAGRSYTHAFNTRRLPSGVYVVTVNSNGAMTGQSRVILQR